MRSSAPDDVTAAIAEPVLVGQVVDFVRWVGDGRKLTQKGAVTLAEVADPPVWWRLLIPAATPLSRLHDVIQKAMGWQDHHLHSFTDGHRSYGLPDLELAFTDERAVRLGDLDIDRGAIRYTYDFGDDWEHEIVVEALGTAEPGERYP